ncbi:hypothetical protein ACJX0J_000176, partial [Zea mays]
ETKLGRLAYTQDRTTRGIYDLCEFTKRLDQSPKADTRQVTSSTSRPAIESSERIVRVASLPPALEPESPRIEAPKVVRSSTVMSASGLSLLAGTTIPPKRHINFEPTLFLVGIYRIPYARVVAHTCIVPTHVIRILVKISLDLHWVFVCNLYISFFCI